jgi:DNA invertase Pin-like site-specific DNA recombinase
MDLGLVWRLDRSARSAFDALRWLEQLDGSGAGLKILTREIGTTLAACRLFFTPLAAVAEVERELLRDRVSAGISRASALG